MDGDAGNIHAGDSGNGVKNAPGAAERPLPAAVNCSQITRGPQEYFLRPFVWSGVRESDPPPRLGKPMYYRCTNPAEQNLL